LQVVLKTDVDWLPTGTPARGSRLACGWPKAPPDPGRGVVAISHFRHDPLSAQPETMCALPHRRQWMLRV